MTQALRVTEAARMTTPGQALDERTPPKLELRGVSKRFETVGGVSGVQALQDIHLAVAPGEIYALVGPSGCGKTTLLNIVAGFERPSAGEVRVDGVPVQGPGPERGVVFQEHALFPWLSALDNVRFGPAVRGRRDLLERCGEFLALVGLQGFERHYPAQLSGGMRQRVALARVLANAPAVLLMDEPFGALDAQTRAQMHQLLLDIWERLSPTILFVTHDVDEAIYLADRVGVMSARPGRLVAELAVGLPRPRTPDALLGPSFLELKARLLALLRSTSRPEPATGDAAPGLSRRQSTAEPAVSGPDSRGPTPGRPIPAGSAASTSRPKGVESSE